MPSGPAVSLRGIGGGRVSFHCRLDFLTREVDGVLDLVLAAYSYRLLEFSGREILVFHWRPEGLSSVTHPHLHLTSRLRPIPLEPVGQSLSLADHHIPTGPVALAAVIRYLIAEIGVEPRRPAWSEILATAAI